MTDRKNQKLGNALADLFMNDELGQGYCASCGESVEPDQSAAHCPRCKGILIPEARRAIVTNHA